MYISLTYIIYIHYIYTIYYILCLYVRSLSLYTYTYVSLSVLCRNMGVLIVCLCPSTALFTITTITHTTNLAY